jgi:hypothetical protein
MRSSHPPNVAVVRFEQHARTWTRSSFPFLIGALWVAQSKLRSSGVSRAGALGGRESLHSFHSSRRQAPRLFFPLRVALSANFMHRTLYTRPNQAFHRTASGGR